MNRKAIEKTELNKILALVAEYATLEGGKMLLTDTQPSTVVSETRKRLKTTEEAEDFLMQLGFRDFRVRMVGKTAKIQLPESQLGLLLDNRETIVEMLRKTYAGVLLDLEVRDEQ